MKISRTEIRVPGPEGTPRAILYVTYYTKDLPPGLLKILKEDWDEEKEAALIREDLKKRRETLPRTVRI